MFQLRDLPLSRVRSQKARGVHGLVRQNFYPFITHGLGTYAFAANPPNEATLIFQSERDITKLKKAVVLERTLDPFPAFARPCPTVPRHGFVESRVVKNADELLTVFKEAVAEDKGAEVLLMPRFPAQVSGVATNAGVAFGFGNDGVTGAGTSRFIPGPVTRTIWNNQIGVGNVNDYGVHDTAYVEIVEGARDKYMNPRQNMVAVQVRDGPEQSAAKNFVPRDMVVKSVISLHKEHLDLLVWERKINTAVRENGGPEGLVFWFPGGSLASHYSVHAVQLGVAVVTDQHKPVVGSNLKAEGPTRREYEKEHYARLAGLLKCYLDPSQFNLRDHRTYALLTSMATIHAMSTWEPEDHLLALQAASAATLVRFIAAITAGEDRHYYSSAGPWNNTPSNHKGYRAKSKVNWDYLIGYEKPKSSNTDRDGVVFQLLDIPSQDLQTFQRAVADDLSHPFWRSGYGGKKWAKAAKSNCSLLKSIETFIKHPTAKRWQRIILKLNRTVNLVHNGNVKLVTKYVGMEEMNIIARCPTFGFMNPFAAHLVLGDSVYFCDKDWRNRNEQAQARKQAAERTPEVPQGQDASGKPHGNSLLRKIKRAEIREYGNSVLDYDDEPIFDDDIPF